MAAFVRSAKSLTKLAFGTNKYTGDNNWQESDGKLYDKKTKDIDGKTINLEDFYGNVSLVTNVACQCGYTKPSYTEMEKYSEKYYDEGLRILLFPSNEFFGQEPGTPDEIKEFVKDGYPKLKATFFEKSEVNGDKTNDIYVWLKKIFPGDITWNFATKFVIGKDGIPVKRFDKNDGWKQIEDCIKEELAKEFKGKDAKVDTNDKDDKDGKDENKNNNNNDDNSNNNDDNNNKDSNNKDDEKENNDEKPSENNVETAEDAPKGDNKL